MPSWRGPGAEADGGLQTGHPTRLWGMEEGERSNGSDGTTATINAVGLRGPMPELPRPAGRQRILTLGDSSFFGFLVGDEEVFTHQLQRYLRDRGVDVDVVNGGVAGYSIAQHQILMDEVGWDLEPTLIVYCNLWSDNTWDTFRDEDLLAARRFAQYNPLVHSAAMRLLVARLSKPETEDGGRIIMWRGEQGWPEGKTRRVPLSRYIALHDGLVREAAGRGIGGAYLIPTNSFMLSGELDTSTAPSWDPYYQAFHLLGSHHNQPVVDVGGVFQESISGGLKAEDLLLDLMHPSAEGHRRMAEALGAALLAAGWPGNSLAGQPTAVDPLAIADHPAPDWTDDDGAGSSQRYLFDISEEEQQAIRERAAAMAEAGPEPSRPIIEPEDEAVKAPQVSGWGITIALKGGSPPYKVVVRDHNERAAGSARMLEPTEVSLYMRADLDDVTVEITDATGKVTTASASKESPQVTVELGVQ